MDTLKAISDFLDRIFGATWTILTDVTDRTLKHKKIAESFIFIIPALPARNVLTVFEGQNLNPIWHWCNLSLVLKINLTNKKNFSAIIKSYPSLLLWEKFICLLLLKPILDLLTKKKTYLFTNIFSGFSKFPGFVAVVTNKFECCLT